MGFDEGIGFCRFGTVKVSGTIGLNGQRIEAEVKVTAAPVIESATGKYTLDQYQTLQLTAKDSGRNTLPVTWGIQDAGNDAAASINQNGILLAVKPGTVTVTAQPQNGLGIIKQDITISSKNIVSFAYKGTAMASNQADSARSPVQAIDEDLISMWRAANNSDSQWFQLQMKQFVPVTGVKIRWYEGNQPQAFVLKTSTDGSDWKTVYTRTTKIDTDKNDYSEIIVLDQTENAKYVRMESSKAGNFPMGIIEFQVFGAPQITTPAQNITITSQTGAFGIVSKGVTLQLEATVTPDTASDARVEWTITNEDGTATDKATVSPSGIVTPLKNGTVKVTAAAVDGSNVTASQTITISNQDLINVALNKSATATTSGGDSNLPSAAVDGSRTTRWGSAVHAPQDSSFSIDLQGEYTISTIALYFDSGAFPVDFKLQYSMDNITWNDIKNVTGNSSPNQTYTFAPVNAKYVRTISSKTTNKSWGYSIFEFEVYGKESQVEKTTAEVAAKITALETPAKGATKITLPAVDGYDIAIKSSSNEEVIALDGTITPPVNNTDVKLVLSVSKGGVTADTKELTVTVPGVKGLQPSVDQTELLAKLKEAKAIVADGYTADSYKILTNAVAAAQTVANNQTATQAQVDDSLTNLQAAIDGLKTVTGEADKSALKTLYNANKERQKGRYTDSSWQAFTVALSNVKSILDDIDATQLKIDAAKNALTDAVNGLKNRPSSSRGSTGTTPVTPSATSTTTTTTNALGGTDATVSTKPDTMPVVTGNRSSITVTVPTDVASIIASATAEKATEVKIAAPTASLVEQLKNASVKNVDLTIQISSAVANNTNANAKIYIAAEQAVLQAARDEQKDVTLKVTDFQTGKEMYSWSFSGSNLKNSIAPVGNVDLALSVAPIRSDVKASAVVAGNTADQSVSGLIVKFGNNGLLPAPATIRVYVGNQEGCTPNSKLYLYYFNTTANVLEQLPPSEYTVDAQGYVTFSIAHCSSYVVLPKNAANPYPVKSDTTYPVGVKNGKTYTFGITVSGNAIPSLAVGNSKVFESTMKREGNKYYVTVKAVGTSGAMTALYSTLPGQKSTVLCYLAVAK